MTRHVLALVLISLVGCTGDRGPAGKDGIDGQLGSAGSNGSNGNDIILSARAKHGLDIAPVVLNLNGLDGPGVEKVGLGSYWVNAVIDCSGCHNSPSGGYLAGGTEFPIDASGDYVFSRNLTPDPTNGLKLTEAQFIEALQTGRDFKGPAMNGMLIVMPWNNFRWMHTDDLKAIYAYLKVIPAVNTGVGPDAKGPAAAATPIALPTVFDRGDVARPVTPETDFMGNPLPDPDGVLRGLDIDPLDHSGTISSNDAEGTARFARGAYLVNAAACNDCHTNPAFDRTPGPNLFKITTAAFLSGGGVFVTPPGLGPVFGTTRSMAKNLTGGTNGFFAQTGINYAVFAGILASGEHIDDPVPTPLAWPMPWDHFRNMETDDLVSLYTYLINLPRRGAANDKLTQGAAVFCDATHACPAGYTTCNMNGQFGNECVGNTCVDDSECGACQHCVGTGPKACVAPDPANGADQACVNAGI